MMQKIFLISLFYLFFTACSACYSCSFQYFLNEDDQTNNTNLVSFTSNGNCASNFRRQMEELFLSRPFRVEDSFSCRKMRN